MPSGLVINCLMVGYGATNKTTTKRVIVYIYYENATNLEPVHGRGVESVLDET
jgi:hypothetical protein